MVVELFFQPTTKLAMRKHYYIGKRYYVISCQDQLPNPRVHVGETSTFTSCTSGHEAVLRVQPTHRHMLPTNAMPGVPIFESSPRPQIRGPLVNSLAVLQT